MKKEPRSARGPELCYVDGVSFNTYRKMFANTFNSPPSKVIDIIIEGEVDKVIKIQKLARGWLTRKKIKIKILTFHQMKMV